MRMARAPIFLLPMFFLGCSDQDPTSPAISPEFSAAAVWWEEGVDAGWTLDAYVPCVGEEIHFSGDIWYRWHYVLNDKREIWHASYGPEPGLLGLGSESGHLWTVKASNLHGATQVETWIVSPGEPFQVINAHNPRYDFVNQSTGQVLSWPFRYHLARNAAGDVKAGFYVEACRLKK